MCDLSDTYTVRGCPGATIPPATISGYARSKIFRTPTSASNFPTVHAALTCARPYEPSTTPG